MALGPERGGLAGLWRWGVSPAVPAVGVMLLVGLVILDRGSGEGGAPAVFAAAAGFVAASFVVQALLATREEVALGLLERWGLLCRLPFPFFLEELNAPDAGRRLTARWRPLVVPVFLLLLAAVVPGSLALVGSAEHRAGRMMLSPGERVESYRVSEAVDGRLREYVGARVTATGLARAGDGAWVAQLRFDDLVRDRGATVALRAGESVQVRGYRYGMIGLAQADRVGALRIAVTGDDGVRRVVTLSPGQRTPVGDVEVEVVRATFARLGAMGPAALVRVFDGDEVRREAWVYLHDAGFDGRHAGSTPALELDGLEAASRVVLGVSRASGLPWRSLALGGGLGIVLCLGWLLGRPRTLLRGRDGDWEIVRVGGLGPVAPGVEALLPERLRSEWRDVVASSAERRRSP